MTDRTPPNSPDTQIAASDHVPLADVADDALYFGTWQQAGHYTWRPGMQKSPLDHVLAGRLDSGRWQARRARQGEAKITKLNGWTILSFPDYSVDSRGGSHSTFALRGEHDFADAIDLARKWFPEVFERFTFDVVEALDAAS